MEGGGGGTEGVYVNGLIKPSPTALRDGSMRLTKPRNSVLIFDSRCVFLEVSRGRRGHHERIAIASLDRLMNIILTNDRDHFPLVQDKPTMYVTLASSLTL